MLKTMLIVGLGGFIGAIARMLLIGVVTRLLPHHINFGTLFVNIIGSFLIALLFSYAQSRGLSTHVKSFVSTGILGALTTFSTFSYENLLLLQGGLYISFLLNITLNVVCCLFAAWIGFMIFK